jgi:hypothetical protein
MGGDYLNDMIELHTMIEENGLKLKRQTEYITLLLFI